MRPRSRAKGALTLVMQLTGLREDQVFIHTTMLGGGLGRKAEQDFIGQAVQVGMALKRPVQLVWPREEDFTHDQYRPMALVRMQRQPGPTATSAAGPTATCRRRSSASAARRSAARATARATRARRPCPTPSGRRRVEWVSHPSPIPVGFWRSVGASINTFAVESMIDELAAAAGQDPYEFRRSRLTDPRWLAVLEAAASAANWGLAPRRASARGIAVGSAFNTIVAMVVEVAAPA